MIEREQPYLRRPGAPQDDPLWILQDLNNTDKHRLIPMSVVGLHDVEARADNESGVVFTVQSPDVVLEDGKVFFTLIDNGRYDNIRADVSCAVAFQQAMQIGGRTVNLSAQLFQVASRVNAIVHQFRSIIPSRRCVRLIATRRAVLVRPRRDPRSRVVPLAERLARWPLERRSIALASQAEGMLS